MINGFLIKDGVLEAYTQFDTLVIVPDGVTIIGRGAFKGCTGILEVILPETVTSIMDEAFKGCRNLKKINFPEKLTFIGEYAFHRCHSLQSIKLPLSITTLSNCAFLYCDGLILASIPGVTHLGKQAFLNDVALRTLEISKDLDPACICDVFTGCGNISEIRLFCNITFPIKNVIDVLSSASTAHPLVKAIAKDVFRMMEILDGVLLKFLINLKHVEIPYGIKAIGKSCFFDKKGILSVKLPKTITEIGSRAFRNCINLERVEFVNDDHINQNTFDNDSVSQNTFSNNDIRIDKDAFKNCTTLKYIITDGMEYELNGLPDYSDERIPFVVRTIHSQLLSNFFLSGTTLIKYRGSEERVVVPDGVTIILEKAFAGNEAIGRVILPDSVREIHEEAFADCLLLQTINLPEGLRYLGKSAFENCVKLIRITLPESLTIIEKSVFNRCKKLSEVKFSSNLKEINDLAFYGCHSLKNIHLPDKLMHIGDLAFYKSLSLREITLPNSLCRLGNNVFTESGIKSATVSCDLEECGTDVFSQCNKLKNLVFEEGVRRISDKFAFCCPSLTFVTLPSSISYIGKNAFEGSIYIKEWLTNQDVDKTELSSFQTIFMDGKELSGDIIIPDGIIAIAGGAFYGNDKITSITLPNTLIHIGARSFCGCTSLKNITLPERVTELTEGVFAYCTSLEWVTSYGAITSICDYAFYKCQNMVRVPLKDASHIGKYAFYGCKKLKHFYINCQDILEDAFKNTGFLDTLIEDLPILNTFQKEKRENDLIILSNTVIDGKYCSKDVIIPEGIVAISPYAFARNDSITSIIFPSTLVTIGEGAFSGCKNLAEIHFPFTIKTIGKKAFEKCLSLTTVYGNIQEIKESAYSYCINLKTVLLEGIHALLKETFCGCTALEKFECKELKLIGDSCFSECISLEGFNFINITMIGENAFSQCDSIKGISLPSNCSVSAHAFSDCGHLEEVIVSRPLQIHALAFIGSTAIKQISTNDQCYKIDSYFSIFDRFIPNDIRSIYLSAISCFIVDETFSLIEYTRKGRFLSIPEGIKKIESEVFRDAMNLCEIIIPSSVEYIGARAFYNTLWLERQTAHSPMLIINNILIDASKCQGDVVIPDFAKLVSGWAFANCFELTKVIFTSLKTKVEEYAFRNCIHLKQITVADGTTYQLTGISDRNYVQPIDENQTSNDIIQTIIKHIVMDCYNCFKTDKNNALIECTGNISNLTLANGITEISNRVFQNSNLLTYITLAKDTTKIGESAFEQCKWLILVKNAFYVTRIEKLAFSGCSLLEEIELSDKLQFIGTRAFEHCTSLKRIVIPEGITEIPEKAFYRCKSLTKITLPSTLKRIGKEAFAFCYELEELHLPKELESIDTKAFAWCSKLKITYFENGNLFQEKATNFDQTMISSPVKHDRGGL